MRSSRSILVVAAVLAILAAHTAVHGLGALASLAHGTDVHRDDVGERLEQMFDAGAVDHDRAAAVMKLPAYLDEPADGREAYEQVVRWQASFFLTDTIVRRIGHERCRVGTRALLGAATCFAAACTLAALSRRVARLERVTTAR